jgi:hypothetical protein
MKYWNGEGQYQDLFDKHFKSLVPESGRADTAEGNALRAIARINHDVFNNGAGNIVRETEETDDDGEYYTVYEIERWWEEYFDDIEDYSRLDVDRLKRKIIEYVQYDKDYGLSDLIDDYIDHIVLRVDNEMERYALLLKMPVTK